MTEADGMDGKCVGVCVSPGYHPLCSEMFGGGVEGVPCSQVEIYSHPEDHYC